MTSSDLTSAFGVPATDLTNRLSRNPRRNRRNRPADREPVPSQDPGEERESGPPTVTDSADADSGAPPANAEPDDQPVEAASTKARAGGVDTGASRSGGTTRSPSRRSGAGRTRGGRSAPSVALDPNTSYAVPIYVHPAVRVAAAEYRKESKCTNAEIAFNAIDDVQHRLAGLVRDRRLQARPDTSLFPGRVRRGRLAGGGAADSAGEARRVLYQFRATEAELEIIDRLVTESGAESRSELVAAAMEESLLHGR